MYLHDTIDMARMTEAGVSVTVPRNEFTGRENGDGVRTVPVLPVAS
jgi:hypothetical protein